MTKQDPSRIHTIDELEALAAEKLSAMAYDYYRSGADEERTLRRNRRAFRRFEIDYRVLVDVSERTTRTTVLGDEVAMPVLVAPTAYQKLAHPDGELATARAAAAAGTVFVLSTLATTSIEDVARAGEGLRWFQLYVHKDRGLTRSFVERAEAAGYRALVLTVDTPLLGRRLADVRNAFALPPGLEMANFTDATAQVSGGDGSALMRYFAERHDASLTFRDVEKLVASTRLPVVLKGIVRGDDAVRGLDAGARAILVSNHGGRQLDHAPATIEALPRVVEAVAGRAEVLVDGGVRHGTDVLKALALGARAVLVGRPVLWGLAAFGEAGVARVLSLFQEELSRTMALAGAPTIASIDASLVRRCGA